jgi:hypothetical protein
MKVIIMVTIYLSTFALFFLMLSAFGILWGSYKDVITSSSWFMCYSLFIGWWLAIFPTREYYLTQEKYFDRVF